MCENPDISIEPHLSKSSKFFQDYIHQGLQTIKEERKKTNRLDLSGEMGLNDFFLNFFDLTNLLLIPVHEF